MVELSKLYNDSTMTLHWHDGGTCHGYSTPEACVANAIKNGWTGKVLEKRDTYCGKLFLCYSLIASSFEHWSQHGRYVAVVELTARRLVPVDVIKTGTSEIETFRIETFPAAGGHSPEIRERTCEYQGTVTPISARIDGDLLIQEFEFIDGPNKGERTKIVTKRED